MPLLRDATALRAAAASADVARGESDLAHLDFDLVSGHFGQSVQLSNSVLSIGRRNRALHELPQTTGNGRS